LYSRREFGKLTAAALPAALLVRPRAARMQAKPNSVWGGVPFGIFAPYHFGPEASDLEPALKAIVKFGLSQTELSGGMVERYAGAPMPPARGAGGGGRAAQTPADQAAAAARVAEIASWRAGVPMDRFRAVRTMFNDAGVTIYAFRVTLTAAMSDAEYDYAFNAAKALGATQLTMEQPSDRALSKRIGDFAERHSVNVGYHLHNTATVTAWDEVMAQSPRNGIQLDIGHYVAGTGVSPVPLIEKHHARIFSMHLKDTKHTDGIRTVYTPWGEGDTPVREILQVLKKNRWAIPSGIEFEHAVPPGSTWEAEIEKCIQYGKSALLG
jgi:sugar phosphate isomerase/epimerase